MGGIGVSPVQAQAKACGYHKWFFLLQLGIRGMTWKPRRHQIT
jgi:hypothetical protein